MFTIALVILRYKGKHGTHAPIKQKLCSAQQLILEVLNVPVPSCSKRFFGCLHLPRKFEASADKLLHLCTLGSIS